MAGRGGRAREAFEFASAHFLAFSALIIAVGVLSATIFLQGYLSVFDWRLIWLVEYTDILKSGLVAVAILSGLSVWFRAFVENAFLPEDAKPQNDKEKQEVAKRRAKNALIGYGLIAGFLILFLAMQYFLATQPRYFLVILIAFVAAYLFVVVTTAIDRASDTEAVTARTWVGDFFGLVIFAYLVGMLLGNIAKEAPGFERDVFTRQEQFREVGLVMVTSRYVVLFRDGHSLVLPSADVTRIEQRPRRPSATWF